MCEEVKDRVQNQFHDFLRRGGMSVIEYALPDGEFLAVDIHTDEDGIVFEFDNMDKPAYFSGDVETIGDSMYQIRYDEYVTELDQYLMQINDEITEGFLIPSNLLT